MAADGILALPPLRDVIRAYNLQASKAFGQNYLLDLNLTRKIARAADLQPQDKVVEIGGGPGGLTRALLIEGAHQLTVIEKDQRFLPALRDIQQVSDGRLSVVCGDALHWRWGGNQGVFKVVSNLPYNIGTAVVVQALLAQPPLGMLVVMLQKEVVLRIGASVGSSDYGRLSVVAQVMASVEVLFDVPPTAFVPPPKIMSSVVRIVPHRSVAVNIDALQKLTAAAFGQRRKMLRQSLKSVVPDVSALLAQIDMPVTARAEDLSPEHYRRLSLCL